MSKVNRPLTVISHGWRKRPQNGPLQDEIKELRNVFPKKSERNPEGRLFGRSAERLPEKQRKQGVPGRRFGAPGGGISAQDNCLPIGLYMSPERP